MKKKIVILLSIVFCGVIKPAEEEASRSAIADNTGKIRALLQQHGEAEKIFTQKVNALTEQRDQVAQKVAGAKTYTKQQAHDAMKEIDFSVLDVQTGDHVAVLKAAAAKTNPDDLTLTDINALVEYYRHDPAFKEYGTQMQKIFEEKNASQQAIENQLNPLLDARLKQLEARTPWQRFTQFLHDVVTGDRENHYNITQRPEMVRTKHGIVDTQETQSVLNELSRKRDQDSDGRLRGLSVFSMQRIASALYGGKSLHATDMNSGHASADVKLEASDATIKSQLLSSITSALDDAQSAKNKSWSYKQLREQVQKLKASRRELASYNAYLAGDGKELSHRMVKGLQDAFADESQKNAQRAQEATEDEAALQQAARKAEQKAAQDAADEQTAPYEKFGILPTMLSDGTVDPSTVRGSIAGTDLYNQADFIRYITSLVPDKTAMQKILKTGRELSGQAEFGSDAYHAALKKSLERFRVRVLASFHPDKTGGDLVKANLYKIVNNMTAYYETNPTEWYLVLGILGKNSTETSPKAPQAPAPASSPAVDGVEDVD